MKLNCKPGDLAVIIDSHPRSNPDTGGVLCDVLHHPPSEFFALPDGTTSFANAPLGARWVIRLHRPISVRVGVGGKFRPATYAVCPDSKLRPIRPQADDGQDETLQWRDVPTPTGVPA